MTVTYFRDKNGQLWKLTKVGGELFTAVPVWETSGVGWPD